MSNLPLVSCLCTTYGRPVLLGEAIKCFADQDYHNKELIVLNDQVGVELVMENYPDNVFIINHPTRFNSLGEKRNFLKKLGKGEFFCIWDDDDLYAPYRISKSLELMQGGRYDIVKAQSALLSIDNKNYSDVRNLFHSQACITKEYMEKTNYPEISVGEDMAFEKGARIGSIYTRPFYVYRWGNCGISSGVHHLSGIADQKQSWNRSLSYEPYTKMNGRVVIKAEFQRDYWKEINALKVMKDFS